MISLGRVGDGRLVKDPPLISRDTSQSPAGLMQYTARTVRRHASPDSFLTMTRHVEALITQSLFGAYSFFCRYRNSVIQVGRCLSTTGIRRTTQYRHENSLYPIAAHIYRAWFGVLIPVSLVIFVFAVLGAILRILTFVPDVLGSIFAVFLNNRITGVTGSST
jgi:hypothetical protein